MTGEIRFKKIKVDKTGKVILNYDEIIRDDHVNEYTMKCADKPRPQFQKALNGLRRHVAEICELNIPPNLAHPNEVANIEVRGVSLSWTDDIMGVVITALKTLRNSNSPLVLNTPHLPEEPYSEGGDESMCLTSECVDAIRNLIDEAHRYLEGDRQQLDLFIEPEEKDGEEEDLKETIKKDLQESGVPVNE